MPLSSPRYLVRRPGPTRPAPGRRGAQRPGAADVDGPRARTPRRSPAGVTHSAARSRAFRRRCRSPSSAVHAHRFPAFAGDDPHAVRRSCAPRRDPRRVGNGRPPVPPFPDRGRRLSSVVRGRAAAHQFQLRIGRSSPIAGAGPSASPAPAARSLRAAPGPTGTGITSSSCASGAPSGRARGGSRPSAAEGGRYVRRRRSRSRDGYGDRLSDPDVIGCTALLPGSPSGAVGVIARLPCAERGDEPRMNGRVVGEVRGCAAVTA